MKTNKQNTTENSLVTRFIKWIVNLLHPMPSEQKIQNIWDSKSNEDILFAYHDTLGWIDLAESKNWQYSKTLQNIAKRCKEKLNNRVLPQMMKRKLQGYKPEEIETFMDDYVENNPD